MKFYHSPLFIFSSALFFYGLYWLIETFVDPDSWGILLAAPALLIAVTGMIVHFILKKLFGNKLRLQLLIELVLILSLVILKAIR